LWPKAKDMRVIIVAKATASTSNSEPLFGAALSFWDRLRPEQRDSIGPTIEWNSGEESALQEGFEAISVANFECFNLSVQKGHVSLSHLCSRGRARDNRGGPCYQTNFSAN
jgi:hypothetical protein